MNRAETIFQMVPTRVEMPRSQWTHGLQTKEPQSSPTDVWRDLTKLKAVQLKIKDEVWWVRNDFQGQADLAFSAVGAARPERIQRVGDTSVQKKS